MIPLSKLTVLFDDNCGKCKRWANFIKSRDPQSKFKLIGQNSDEGIEILDSRPQSLRNIDSVFLLSSEGGWHAKSDAIWRILWNLKIPWPLASSIRLVPRFLRDSVYDAISRRR